MPQMQRFGWLAMFAALAILSCRAGDETAPRDPPPSGKTKGGQPTISRLEAGSGSAQIEPGATYQDKRTGLGVNYAYPTLVKIVASGSATYEPIYFPGQDSSAKVYTYGGYFMGGGCWAGISWDFRPDDAWSYASKQYCVMGGAPAGSTTDTVLVKGMGFVTWSRMSSNFPPYCGLSGPECYTYTSGDMSLSVTAFPVEFELYATKEVIQPGQSTTIVGKMTPGNVGGIPIPLTGSGWSWTPDGGSPQSPGCPNPAPGDSIPCEISPTASGTFTMSVIANGNPVTKTVHVTVQEPTLSLTADRNIITPGDLVTFSATMLPDADGWEVTGWSWEPDAGVSALRAAPSSKATPKPPQQTPRPSARVATPRVALSVAGCSNTAHECTMPVTQSGTMTVTATVDGDTQTATAHVALRAPDGGDGTPGNPTWWIGTHGPLGEPVGPAGGLLPCKPIFNGTPFVTWITVRYQSQRAFWIYPGDLTKVPGTDSPAGFVGIYATWMATFQSDEILSERYQYEGENDQWVLMGRINLRCWETPARYYWDPAPPMGWIRDQYTLSPTNLD